MIRKLAPYTKGYRVWIFLGVLCSAGEAVLELLLPKLMSNIVDVGIAGGKGKVALFKKGQVLRTVDEKDAVEELFKEIMTLE